MQITSFPRAKMWWILLQFLVRKWEEITRNGIVSTKHQGRRRALTFHRRRGQRIINIGCYKATTGAATTRLLSGGLHLSLSPSRPGAAVLEPVEDVSVAHGPELLEQRSDSDGLVLWRIDHPTVEYGLQYEDLLRLWSPAGPDHRLAPLIAVARSWARLLFFIIFHFFLSFFLSFLFLKNDLSLIDIYIESRENVITSPTWSGPGCI